MTYPFPSGLYLSQLAKPGSETRRQSSVPARRYKYYFDRLRKRTRSNLRVVNENRNIAKQFSVLASEPEQIVVPLSA